MRRRRGSLRPETANTKPSLRKPSTERARVLRAGGGRLGQPASLLGFRCDGDAASCGSAPVLITYYPDRRHPAGSRVAGNRLGYDYFSAALRAAKGLRKYRWRPAASRGGMFGHSWLPVRRGEMFERS